MNATMLTVVEETIQDVRYLLEPVTRDDRPTFADRISNFYYKSTESSYNAWERSGKTEQL